MKKKTKLEPESVSGQFAPRIFTYDQLASISDENCGILNRSIDPKKLNENESYLLQPLQVHSHAFMKPVKPHLRVLIASISDRRRHGMQDVTFEQFQLGREVG